MRTESNYFKLIPFFVRINIWPNSFVDWSILRKTFLLPFCGFQFIAFWCVNSNFKPITFINLLTGNLWRTLVYRRFIILEFHQKAQFIALRLFFVNFFFESPSKYLGTERLGGIFTGKNIQKFFLFLSLYYTVKISLIASNN